VKSMACRNRLFVARRARSRSFADQPVARTISSTSMPYALPTKYSVSRIRLCFCISGVTVIAKRSSFGCGCCFGCAVTATAATRTAAAASTSANFRMQRECIVVDRIATRHRGDRMDFDKTKVAELLNRILEMELAGTVRYTHYSLMV